MRVLRLYYRSWMQRSYCVENHLHDLNRVVHLVLQWATFLHCLHLLDSPLRKRADPKKAFLEIVSSLLGGTDPIRKEVGRSLLENLDVAINHRVCFPAKVIFLPHTQLLTLAGSCLIRWLLSQEVVDISVAVAIAANSIRPYLLFEHFAIQIWRHFGFGSA